LTGLRTNEEQLVALGIEAEVSHPTQSGSYAVDDYGRPIILPGMSGVVRNVRVGDPVYRWAADHLEPGVSAGCSDRGRHQALQFLACLGNTVRVVSGPAAGAEGTVVGKHAFVLVDFPQDALDALAPGDRLLVRANGQGLRLLDFPDVALRSCSPELLRSVVQPREGRLRVEVVTEIPAYLMGAGLGMSSEWANADVMFTRRETVDGHGVGELRLGDVVVMRDQDHRFGRGYRKGMSAVGIVAHGGHAGIPGHGTGVVTILSAPSDRLELVRSERANVRDYLELPA
jgi:Domain of unknown function (DUF4438), N-terminal/Domain of unknown function (DUF4438), C-terminal